jgi:acyl-CoA dehydrogenase
MLIIAALLLLLVILWSLTFFRLRLKVSTLVIVGLFVLYWIVGVISTITTIVLAIIFLPIMLLINIPWLRAHLISRMLLRRVKSTIPPLSKTEQEAIASGSTWWERDLFCGRPDWNKLHTFGQPILLSDGREFLANQVPTLCAMLNDWRITHDQFDLSPEVWNYLKNEKFFGMTIPKRYGGLGFSAYTHSCVITMIASRSYSAAVSVMVPNSLGPAELLQHFGTEAQRDYYLPRLAKGEEIPCFALTSPTAGSDATSITDTGIVCKGIYEGKECLGLRLNWSKRYITLAPVATLVGLAVHVFDPDRLLAGDNDIGISLLLLPAHLPGIEQGKRHWPLHQAFMNGPISGKDVFVSLDQVIGGERMLGKGWHMLTDSLAVGRGISLPAVSTASAKLCYRMTGAYARVREQFGRPIGDFEGIAVALARIGAKTYLCEAARLFTTGAIDSGAKPSIASAITKYHLTELSRQLVNDAMDVHAGRSIILGEHNYLANLYTAIPIGITVEGANILTRNLIIFGQGAFRCHPYLTKELEAIAFSDASKGLLRFDRLIFKHIGFALCNFSRALAYGVSSGKKIYVPEAGILKEYYRQLSRMSTALALVVDVAFLSIGGNLKRQENLSARLGDVLSYLYLASTVLKYFRDNGQSAEDLPFAQYALGLCLFETQSALIGFLDNMPSRRWSWILKKTLFTWGAHYKLPSDHLAHQIAKAMMKPGSQRDRLTQYCFVSDNDQDATSIMEQSLVAAVQCEQAQKKVKEAIKTATIESDLTVAEQVKVASELGIITSEEVEQLNTFYRLQNQAIQVDAQDAKIV